MARMNASQINSLRILINLRVNEGKALGINDVDAHKVFNAIKHSTSYGLNAHELVFVANICIEFNHI